MSVAYVTDQVLYTSVDVLISPLMIVIVTVMSLTRVVFVVDLELFMIVAALISQKEIAIVVEANLTP
jgi:hypothetical protein